MTKVGLYNPYLVTKGGGEKVCLALAEALNKDLDCEVTLISHSDIDLNELADYFQLDLEGINLQVIDFETLSFKIIHRLPLPGRIRNLIHDFKALRKIKRQGYDVFINNCYQSNLPAPIKNSVYMCMFPQKLGIKQNGLGSFKKTYVFITDVLARIFLHPLHSNPIETYPLITANSAYTQGYIKKYWNRESQILYPICDNMKLQNPPEKEKLIMHVGRFFENVGESHHKRQDLLLEAFSELKDLHEAGWRVCFAGSVAEDAGTLKYLLSLIKSGQDLPVEFRFNCSFRELKDLYNKASIYWHATGFGSDQNLHPEKQEHFGITTVEAMSAGCIPIVINAAGQKESVVNGQDGFLWNTKEELKTLTNKVANMDNKSLAIIQEKAQADAHKYDQDSFRKLVKEIFSEIVL